jgi:hypothetical protein
VNYIILILLTFIISSTSRAQNINLQAPISNASPESTVDQRLGTGFLYSGYQTLKKALPENKYKCAMKIYEQSLGLEEYQSVYHMGKTNAGIATYFSEQLSQNACLAVAATQFAETLKKKDKDNLSDFIFTNILETAGKDRYANYPPGWVWKEALKFTNGDKNSALFLIGLCGNEELPSYEYEIAGSNKVILAKKDLSKLNEDLKAMKKNMANLPADELKLKMQFQGSIDRVQSDIQRTQKSIQNPQEIQKRQLECPDNNSGFTVPKSLGETVDIPQSLKAKVIKIQRPGSTNLDTLKAKYYHVTGSAFMGCQLAKCGISPDLAADAEKFFAHGYRTIRLCDLVKRDLKNLKNLSQKIGIDENDENFQERAEAFLKAEAKQMIAEGLENHKILSGLIAQGITGQKALEKLKKTKCDTLSDEKEPVLAYLCSATWSQRHGDTSESSDRDLEQKIGYLLREYDSSILFRKWYIGGGSFLGMDVPCTGIRADGPPQLSGPNISCNIKGWSVQRCATAVGKLATWDIDFEWTKKQHEVGARFGAGQCQKQDVNEPLDKAFCKIIEDNSKEQFDSRGSKIQMEILKKTGVK